MRILDLAKEFEGNPEYDADFAAAEAEFRLIDALVKARAAANMSQKDVAEKLGTKQSAIARLEGGRVSPSIATLQRYAAATGRKLEISIR